MSDSVHLQSIDALDQLRDDMCRFGDRVEQLLGAADRELWRTRDWLEERARHWRVQIALRYEELNLAQRSVARCEASGVIDDEGRYYPPNCGDEQRVLSLCRAMLLEAEQELEAVQHHTRETEYAAGKYEGEAGELRIVLGDDLLKAVAFLNDESATLREYAALRAPHRTGS